MYRALAELKRQQMAALTLEERMNRSEQERHELEEAQRRADEARRQAEEAAYLEKEERERRVRLCLLHNNYFV